MAINKGNIKTSANYDVRIKAPMDARRERPQKSDLITKTSWSFDGNTVYVYEGMQVFVKDEKKTYTLIDESKMFENDYSGWELVNTGKNSNIVIDTELDENSVNPVQNSTIAKALSDNEKATSEALNELDAKVSNKANHVSLYYKFGQGVLTDDERLANTNNINTLKNEDKCIINIINDKNTYTALGYYLQEEKLHVIVPATAILPEHIIIFSLTGDFESLYVGAKPFLVMDVNNPSSVASVFNSLLYNRTDNEIIESEIPVMVADTYTNEDGASVSRDTLSLSTDYIYAPETKNEISITYQFETITYKVFFNANGEVVKKTIINGSNVVLDANSLKLYEIAENILLFNGNLTKNTTFKCKRGTNIAVPIGVRECIAAETLEISYEIIIQNGKYIETWILSNSGSTTLLSSEEIGSGAEATIVLDMAMSDSSENGVQNKVIKQYVDSNIRQINSSINENTDSINTLNETVSANTAALEVLNGTEEGSVTHKITEVKNSIDSYTVNGKKISESPTLNSDDVTVSENFSTIGQADEIVYPGDIITDAIAKLEVMMANTTLALTAALNDLEARIGEPSSYDEDGNKIEGRGLYKICEELQNQINNI